MTIAEAIKQDLEGYGLWPDEATTVVEAMQSSEDMKAMAGEWEASTEESPGPQLAVLLMAAKRAAIEHLEATNPQHFALYGLKA